MNGLVGHPLPLTGERTLPGIPGENYWFQRHVAAYRFAARTVSGRILDVGSGEGYGAASLAGSGRVVAMENDAEVASHAARSYPSLVVVVADACHLPAADGSVDAVVSLQVLEHLYCADRFVAACRGALHPGGVLVLSTPNRVTFSPDGVLNPFHVYEYDTEELASLLRLHFGEVRMLGLRHGPRLSLRERADGRSLPAELMATPFESLSPARQRLVRSVTARDFRMSGRRVDSALDLVAVCRP
ncbi:MAG: class I SAM-dependent methyltransferase [Actinobacteria bacterium]|nr:class I SAM-dependent methyltransferase [Actinomycetota bacterium]